MKHTTMTRLLRRSALVVALLGLLAGTASAQTYNLVADQYSWNGIQMWGFKLDTGQACGSGGSWALGPMLAVDAAGNPSATNLTVNLRNCLANPVSIVIPGQSLPAGSAPTFINDAGRQRAASFTSEASGAGGTVSYTWTGLKPGTFLYHSGSDVGRQVHMGLYGAVIVDYNAATGEAYPGVVYDVDAVLVASEVDPALHGAADSTAKPLNYKPKYFLVNGIADGSTTLSGVDIGDNVLLRIANAGLVNYVPNLLGEDLQWVAEDGNPYAYARTSYGAFLPAGKTMDALWTPVTPGPHTLYDRRLHLSSDGEPGGGLVATIQVGDVNLPTADAGPDQFHVAVFEADGTTPNTVTLDGSGSSGLPPQPGNVAYAWTLQNKPALSTATLTGATTVSPSFIIDIPGTYVASLVVTDSNPPGVSAPDVVVVNTNLAPVAVASGPAEANVGALVQLDGSGSSDPDGDAITYDWQVTAPDLSTFSLAGAAPSFTATAAGDYVAELIVSDFELSSEPDTVTVTAAVGVNAPPNAVQDFDEVLWWRSNQPPTSVAINVLANDTDDDGIHGIDINSVSIVTPPIEGGTILNITGGVVTYQPRSNWRGTDYFTYQVCDTGGLCSSAPVIVNVVR